MDTSTFDNQIESLQGLIENQKNQMEMKCKAFLKATNEFVVTWFNECVENAIKSHPEVAQKHGTEGLHKLKSDLQNIVEKAQDFVEEHVNQDVYWAHSGSITDRHQTGFYESKLKPNRLDSAVRQVLGYVGFILIKYGFADTGRNSDWEIQTGDERPRLKYGYSWS